MLEYAVHNSRLEDKALIAANSFSHSVTGLPPACCQDLELQLDDEELEVMISDADRSGRGEGITEEEYLHIMKNSIWI